MSSRPAATTVRPDTKAQFKRHREAAKALRWTYNQFYLEAADRLANTVLTSEKPIEQLIVNRDQPSLNQ